VLGISVDSREKNKAFAEWLGATFAIPSDEGKTDSPACGVLIPMLPWGHCPVARANDPPRSLGDELSILDGT